MRVGLVAVLVLALGLEVSGQTVLILDADPPGGPVARGQTISWSLFIQVDKSDNQGLAGIAADLSTDLTQLAGDFRLSKAENTSDEISKVLWLARQHNGNLSTRESRTFWTCLIRNHWLF